MTVLLYHKRKAAIIKSFIISARIISDCVRQCRICPQVGVIRQGGQESVAVLSCLSLRTITLTSSFVARRTVPLTPSFIARRTVPLTTQKDSPSDSSESFMLPGSL